MFNNEEKQILNEACTAYLQLAAQQMSPEQMNILANKMANIFQKLNNSSVSGGKPTGITEEWFKGVCESCDKLKGSECIESVTKKYPGKCDPILKFERIKFLEEKEQEGSKE